MMEDPRARRCDDYQEGLAELALGVLTGRERAATLAHVDSCDHCAEELEQLSRTADAVVYVAPEEEPPMGFEVRLFNRMGLAESASEPPAPRRRGPFLWGAPRGRWALAAAAAVVALVAGLSIGWVTGSSGNHPTQGVAGRHPSAAAVATADLVERGRSVGRVVTYGGPTPWMVVTLADSSIDGRVSCAVVTDRRRGAQGGRLHRIARVRRLGRAPPGGAPRRAHGRGGVLRRDGDRHRHVGVSASTGRCRACRARPPARRCSRPGPG